MRRSCTDWLGRKTERERCATRELMKDKYGNVIISLEAVLKRWKEYFVKLMNKENDRELRTEEVEVVNEEINCACREEVKNATRRIKTGKAVGPDELPVKF